jgi:hypothetical protein
MSPAGSARDLRRLRRAVGTQVVSVLALGPPSGFHPVAHDRGEGANREVLVAVEGEDRWAVGTVTDNGKCDNRHRIEPNLRCRGG